MKELTFRMITERLRAFSLPDFDLVIGIADGGTVPASLVASKLGCDLKMISIKYRDENNVPARPEPVVLEKPVIPADAENILLVDDVSTSGKTLNAARGLLAGRNIKAFVCMGQADYVLFPELDSCVKWPWRVPE